MGMNRELYNNNYIVLPQFLPVDQAKSLAVEFKQFCIDNNLKGDWQVEKSCAYRNYLPFLEILLDKTHEVSTIIDEPLLPTFSYSRIYQHQSTLPLHKDQESCEIVLTINLDCDIPWEIWIRTPYPENKSKPIILNPGDAMLYLGQEAYHWRNEYQGTYYCGLFLCYVKSRGKSASRTYNQMYTHGPGIFHD